MVLALWMAACRVQSEGEEASVLGGLRSSNVGKGIAEGQGGGAVSEFMQGIIAGACFMWILCRFFGVRRYSWLRKEKP